MSRIKKLILFGIILNGVAAWGGVFFDKWATAKAALMADGRAELYFPYREYTLDDLERMYPQIKNKYVATTVTPEETYAKFRQALKDNDLEGAVEQLSKDAPNRYKENVAELQGAYRAGKFKDIYKNSPEKIKVGVLDDASATYTYSHAENGEVFENTISFDKNSAGVWKMSSL